MEAIGQHPEGPEGSLPRGRVSIGKGAPLCTARISLDTSALCGRGGGLGCSTRVIYRLRRGHRSFCHLSPGSRGWLSLGDSLGRCSKIPARDLGHSDLSPVLALHLCELSGSMPQTFKVLTHGPERQRCSPSESMPIRGTKAILRGVRGEAGAPGHRACCWALPLSALELIWSPWGCGAWSVEYSKRLSGG